VIRSEVLELANAFSVFAQRYHPWLPEAIPGLGLKSAYAFNVLHTT
jgi:hypothetical protein